MTFTAQAGGQAKRQEDTLPATDSPSAQPVPALQLPVTTSLETNLPLHVVMSPLRWGRLSLLSFTAYEGYDTNPQFQHLSLGSSVTALSALVVYSIRRGRSELDLQYRPFVWISSKQTYKDLSGTSADLQHTRDLSQNWSLSAGERFRYSPDMQNSVEGNSFSVDFGGGTTTVTPFLSTGRNFLLNTVTLSLNDRLDEQSSLEFHANQNFVRLSGYLGNQSASVPTQEVISYGGGVTWTKHLSFRNTIRASYDYRKQSSPDSSFANADYHVATLGWAHLLTPSVTVSADAGPGWWNAEGNTSTSNQWRTTLRGSVQMSKQFHSGGISLSASRSNDFTGAVSNSFNNRYDLRFEHSLFMHWNLATSASYVQQEVAGGRNLRGELGTAELDYFMSRNWAVFGQARYLSIRGGELSFAPDKIFSVGVRWAWKPEKP